MDSLVRNSASINEMLTRYGVKFGLYKNGSFHEQIFPFDPIARTIEADEWKELSAGLAQRVWLNVSERSTRFCRTFMDKRESSRTG